MIIPISHVLDLQMWKKIMGVSTAFLLRFIIELKFASRKSPRPERNGSADLLEHVSGTIPIARMTLGTSHSKAVCNVRKAVVAAGSPTPRPSSEGAHTAAPQPASTVPDQPWPRLAPSDL